MNLKNTSSTVVESNFSLFKHTDYSFNNSGNISNINRNYRLYGYDNFVKLEIITNRINRYKLKFHSEISEFIDLKYPQFKGSNKSWYIVGSYLYSSNPCSNIDIWVIADSDIPFFESNNDTAFKGQSIYKTYDVAIFTKAALQKPYLLKTSHSPVFTTDTGEKYENIPTNNYLIVTSTLPSLVGAFIVYGTDIMRTYSNLQYDHYLSLSYSFIHDSNQYLFFSPSYIRAVSRLWEVTQMLDYVNQNGISEINLLYKDLLDLARETKDKNIVNRFLFGKQKLYDKLIESYNLTISSKDSKVAKIC